MFRHYRVIFRELVFIISLSYLGLSIAAVGNTVWINKSHYNKIFKILLIYFLFFIIYYMYLNCITNSCNWNTYVTWRVNEYELSEEEMIVSKHVGEW